MKERINIDMKVSHKMVRALQTYFFSNYRRPKKCYTREDLLTKFNLAKFHEQRGVGPALKMEIDRLVRLEAQRQSRIEKVDSSKEKQMRELMDKLSSVTPLTDWEIAAFAYSGRHEVPTDYLQLKRKGVHVVLEDQIHREVTYKPRSKATRKQRLRVRIQLIEKKEYIQLGVDQMIPLKLIPKHKEFETGRKTKK